MRVCSEAKWPTRGISLRDSVLTSLGKWSPEEKFPHEESVKGKVSHRDSALTKGLVRDLYVSSESFGIRNEVTS